MLRWTTHGNLTRLRGDVTLHRLCVLLPGLDFGKQRHATLKLQPYQGTAVMKMFEMCDVLPQQLLFPRQAEVLHSAISAARLSSLCVIF